MKTILILAALTVILGLAGCATSDSPPKANCTT